MIGLLAGSGAWGLFWGGWAALLPAVKAQVGATTGAFGLAMLAVPIGALVGMLGTGSAVDRYGRRAFAVALGLFAATVPLPALVSGTASLAGALLAVGATSGAIEVSLNAATAAEETATGRRRFNQVHAVTPVSMIIAAPLVGLAQEIGLTTGAILAAIATAVAVSAAVNLGRDRHPPRASQPRWSLSRRFLGYGLAAAAVLFLENAVEQWSALLLVHELGTGAFVASLGPTGYMSALALGRLVAQRHGTGLTPRRALILAGGSGAVGVGLAAASPHPALAVAGFALAGLGSAPALPTLLATVGRVAEPPGVAVATVSTVSYLGFVVSPPVVGHTAGLAGLPVALGAVAGVGALLAVGCWRSDPAARLRHR